MCKEYLNRFYMQSVKYQAELEKGTFLEITDESIQKLTPKHCFQIAFSYIILCVVK